MIKPGIELPKNGLTRLIIVLFSLLILTELSSCGGGSAEVKPSLSINSPSVTEGDADTAELIFTITLSEDAASTLTVDYSTTAGSATESDSDFTAVNGQLVITAGSRTASVSVFANGDTVFEQNESFNLVISNPQGLALRENSITGIGMIDNDDDAEPKGYFAGTATINSTDLTDVNALTYRPDNRLIVISPTINVLYDITYTDITLTAFTGTVDVYVNGTLEQDGLVTVSGTTDESSLQGTFAGGTGQATGSFSLTFDTNNNRGASLARIETFGLNQWNGDFNSVDVVSGFLGFNSAGIYGGVANTGPVCEITSGTTVVPSIQANIFQFENSVDPIFNCQYVGTGYTGYGAVIDIAGTDDGMVYAVANGVNAVFAVFSRTP